MKGFRNRFLSGLAVTSLVAISGGALPHVASAASGQGYIRYAEPAEQTTLDPAGLGDDTASRVMNMVFDSLVEYDQTDAGLHGGLAQRYTISPDGKTYTFYIRKGVKFSNGDPLTAQDIVYNLNREASADPIGEGPAVWTGVFTDIVGYQQWLDSKKTAKLGQTGMSGVTSPAPDVVQIKLSKPQPYFLNELALDIGDIGDPAVEMKYGKNFSLHAVGTGPYKIKSWNQGHQLVLVPNPSSWRGNPKNKGVIVDENVSYDLQLLRFEKGEYDYIHGPLPSAIYAKVLASSNAKKDYITAPMNGVTYFAFNTTRAPFNNIDMRLAANYAVNKAEIIRDITNGRATPETQPLPPGIPGYNSTLKGYGYNPNLARQYLKKAGYKGQPITIVYFAGGTDYTRLADMIQQDLMAVGMKVQLKGISQLGNYLTYEYNPKNPWDLTWSQWTQDYPDAQDFLENLLATESFKSNNLGNWTLPEFQKLVDTADALPASDQAQRIADYQKAEKLADDNVCWLFLYNLWQDALVQPWVSPRPNTHSGLMVYLHPVLKPQWNLMSTTH